MTTEGTKECGSRRCILYLRIVSLYNNSTLSDITIKFNGRQVCAHKAILAHKSGYFMTAFTSKFQVCSTNLVREEVDLGDDDDPEAVHAMLRHIYDLPYIAQGITELTSDSGENLGFCLNFFIIADKYDVISLRQKVVPDFLVLLQGAWQTETFVESVKKLCGPDAIHLADPSLQTAVVDFLIGDVSKITHHSSLVKMIEQDKSFTGRVLAGLLKPASGSIRYLPVCHKPRHSVRSGPGCAGRGKGQSDYLAALGAHCVHCGTAPGTAYDTTVGGTARTKLVNTIKVVII
ncbi:hypothetical protein E4T48_00673 [Aureobasidium sp. EXF-10727]|nr:hypothetical protein E4T48_00673 [Aureobasidium sp. EXF-10727]